MGSRIREMGVGGRTRRRRTVSTPAREMVVGSRIRLRTEEKDRQRAAEALAKLEVL